MEGTPPEEHCFYEYQTDTIRGCIPCTVFQHQSVQGIMNHIERIEWRLVLEGVTLMKPYRIEIAPETFENIEESVQYLFEQLMEYGAEFSIRDQGQFVRLSKENTRMVEMLQDEALFNILDFGADWVSLSDGSCVLDRRAWMGIPPF